MSMENPAPKFSFRCRSKTISTRPQGAGEAIRQVGRPMKISGRHYRTIWPHEDGTVEIIDQTKLPHAFETLRLKTTEDAVHAIRTMIVRGAPLIGATAAYGIALAMRADASDANLDRARDLLAATRPTAVNLRWALTRMRDRLRNQPREARAALAWNEAAAIC